MRLLREPLLHFLLVGALLFAADAALREAAPRFDRVIRISEPEIARLRAQWTKQYQHPRAPAEMRALVDTRVREEVLFREALAMRLDRDDSIVRRGLAQKLEFLIEDLATAREPSDAELGARLVLAGPLQPGSSRPRGRTRCQARPGGPAARDSRGRSGRSGRPLYDGRIL